MSDMPRLIAPDLDAKLEANLHRIPAHCREGLLNYVRFGQLPGHFLLAVLCNDLREACGRADEENRTALFQYVYLLTNYAPAGCWGNAARVNTWRTMGLESRERAREATR